MDQYSQAPIYQSEIAEQPKRRAIFETRPLKLFLAIFIPGLISGLVASLFPVISNLVVPDHMAIVFRIYKMAKSVFDCAVTFLFVFKLCKTKKEGLMLLGLNYFVNLIFSVVTGSVSFFQIEERTILSYVISVVVSVLEFVLFVSLIYFLTKNGEKREVLIPRNNGYFGVKKPVLITATILLTVVFSFFSMLVYELIPQSGESDFALLISNFSEKVLYLIFMLIFCGVFLKSRSEKLLFLGVFGVTEYIKEFCSGFVNFLVSSLCVSISLVTPIYIIVKVVIVCAVRVLLLMLLTRERKPRRISDSSENRGE